MSSSKREYVYAGGDGASLPSGLIGRDVSEADYRALAAYYGERVMEKFWRRNTKSTAAKSDGAGEE